MEKYVRDAFALEHDHVINDKTKKMILSLIGLWGKRFYYDFKSTKASSEDDRVGAIFKTTKLSDGRLEIFTRTETLTNLSMLPSHLIALNMEHVYLGRMARVIQMAPGVRVSGMLVDCVFYSAYHKRNKDGEARRDQLQALDDAVGCLKHPSGEPIFRKTHAKLGLHLKEKSNTWFQNHRTGAFPMIMSSLPLHHLGSGSMDLF